MKKINFFESVLVELNRDVEVDDEFIPIDETLFVNTGVFEQSERGDYELCTLKKGSPVYVSMMPNGVFYVTDSENSSRCHAQVVLSDFTLPDNMEFVQSQSTVNRKPRLTK